MTALEISPHRQPALRLPRLLAGMSYYKVTDLRQHERQHGRLPAWGRSGRLRPERLIDLVERSGLTGRGGAGFPTGRKMRSVAAQQMVSANTQSVSRSVPMPRPCARPTGQHA